MSIRVGVVLVAAVGFSSIAVADKVAPPAKQAPAKKGAKGAKPPPVEELPPVEEEAPEEAPEITIPHIKGPKLVDLGHDIEIKVPEGMVLYERVEAQRLVREGGGSEESVLAMVFDPTKDWSVLIEYDDVGYVSDADAHELDAGELLESYKRGTIEQNVRRTSLGIPELFIDGWSELPRYERARRHLVWGLNAHSSEGPVINFFTRILGRNGYISLNLIDAPETIEQSKVETTGLLAATRFTAGARYEDYREGDKSSGMGLKALVLGGAGIATAKAAKAGILMTILLFLKKGIVFIGLGIAGLIKVLLGRKKAAPAPEPAPPDDSPPTP